MAVDDVAWVQVLGWKGFPGPAVFEDAGEGGGSFERVRTDAAIGVVDEDDLLEGGDGFRGTGLGVGIGDEVLEEGDVGAGRLSR